MSAAIQYLQAISAVGGSVSPTVETYDSLLIYLTGQSNALGVVEGDPGTPYNVAITDALIYTGTQFDTLEYGVNNKAYTNTSVGIELVLMYKLVELFGTSIYMAKYGVGSTGLSQDPTSQDFNPYSYELFPTTVSELKTAYDYMTGTLGKNPLVVGVWLQGAQDARYTAMANNYYKSFQVFKKKLNEQAGVNMKWFINRMGLPQRPAYDGDIWDIVRQADVDLIANYADISMIDLDAGVMETDGKHYSIASLETFGNTLAQDIYDNYGSLIV